MTRSDDDPTTREFARPHADGTGWPSDAADQIGKPLDAGRFDDAARQELEPRRRGPLRALLSLIGVAALVVAIVLGLQSVNLWPSFSNPFQDRTTDRSQPVLLKSIQDLARFTSASGNFEVVIDVEKDRRFIPDVIFSERTLFVAAGSVDAYVDFSTIGEGALIVDQTNKTVQVRLPAPQLEKPSIDNDRTYVFAQQRGVVNRIGDVFGGDPNKQQQLYQLAEAKIGEAAKASELTRRAQENTEKMLNGMLTSLGYTTVTITFAAP